MNIKIKSTSVLISRTFFLKLRIRNIRFFLLLNYLVASPIWYAFLIVFLCSESSWIWWIAYGFVSIVITKLTIYLLAAILFLNCLQLIFPWWICYCLVYLNCFLPSRLEYYQYSLLPINPRPSFAIPYQVSQYVT